jgi:predicted nuclease of predicted toxin-antitoxin system
VRWLIDECVDARLAAVLRESGHDVVYMSEVAPRAADSAVMDRAHRENRLLLTEDKDFGDLTFRQARPVPGLVLLRIDPGRRSQKVARLLALRLVLETSRPKHGRHDLATLMKRARGVVKSGIADLASNPEHLKGFGYDASRDR